MALLRHLGTCVLSLGSLHATRTPVTQWCLVTEHMPRLGAPESLAFQIHPPGITRDWAIDSTTTTLRDTVG